MRQRESRELDAILISSDSDLDGGDEDGGVEAIVVSSDSDDGLDSEGADVGVNDESDQDEDFVPVPDAVTDEEKEDEPVTDRVESTSRSAKSKRRCDAVRPRRHFSPARLLSATRNKATRASSFKAPEPRQKPAPCPPFRRPSSQPKAKGPHPFEAALRQAAAAVPSFGRPPKARPTSTHDERSSGRSRIEVPPNRRKSTKPSVKVSTSLFLRL